MLLIWGLRLASHISAGFLPSEPVGHEQCTLCPSVRRVHVPQDGCGTRGHHTEYVKTCSDVTLSPASHPRGPGADAGFPHPEGRLRQGKDMQVAQRRGLRQGRLAPPVRQPQGTGRGERLHPRAFSDSAAALATQVEEPLRPALVSDRNWGCFRVTNDHGLFSLIPHVRSCRICLCLAYVT